MKLVLVTAAVLLVAGFAQEPTDPRPQFEVASIKPNKTGPPAGMIEYGRIRPLPGGRIEITNAPVKMLIVNAYKIVPSQLSGGPPWISSDRYDIVAKAEGNPNPDQLKLMLQSLLADRFGLKFHHETKEASVYALVRAQSKSQNFEKLVHATDGDCEMFKSDAPGAKPDCGAFHGRYTHTGAGLHAKAVSLTDLANSISVWIDPITCFINVSTSSSSACRPVIDRTGIAGTFDIDLEWMPDFGPGQQNADTGPSIFTAIQQQLGLKLEPQKGPVDTLVIDQVEKPSEN